MNTSTKILIAIGVFLSFFITAMIIIFCVKGFTPDVLIQCVLGGSGLEVFVMAGIKIAKTIKGESEEEPWNSQD